MSEFKPAEKNKSNTVYLLYGEDEYPRTERAKALVRDLAPKNEQSLGIEIIDGRAENATGVKLAIRRCIAAVATSGLFGGNKVVWFRDVNYLVANAVGRGREATDAVKELARQIEAGLPERHTLIITASQVAAKSPLLAACTAIGSIEHFEMARGAKARHSQAIGFASAEFKRLGLRMSSDATSFFVERVGVDSRFIHEEARKLAVFVGPTSEGGEDDIVAIVCPSREVVTYEFDDAVGNRDLGGALKIFRRLLFQKEEPIRILFSIWYRLQALAVIHELISTGALRIKGGGRNASIEWTATTEIKTHLGEVYASHSFANPMNMDAWKLGPLAGQAQRFTRLELDRFLQTIYHTRRQLVLSRVPERLTVELLLIQICATARR